MLDHSPGIILANAFFNQLAVVLVERKVLSHCFIDNKASVPLLCLGEESSAWSFSSGKRKVIVFEGI